MFLVISAESPQATQTAGGDRALGGKGVGRTTFLSTFFSPPPLTQSTCWGRWSVRGDHLTVASLKHLPAEK